MKKKKILIFGLTSLIGGIETYIINLTRNIDLEKFEIYFLAQDDIIGINKEKIEGCFKKIYKVENFKRHPIKAMKTLKEIYVKEKFDIVHLNLSTASSALYALPCKKHSKMTKIISHSHAAGNKNEFQHILFKHILNKISDKYLACSYAAGKWMFGKKIANSSKMIITNNAIETEKFIFNEGIREKIRKELNIAKDEFVIGHVGRFNEVKNHMGMLEILQPILSKKRNIKLVLLGKGELEDTVKRKVKELGIDSQVLFLGAKSNVHEYYQIMDVFVLPSKFEGLPIVGIEAQASGLKCIFSNNVTKEVDITGNAIFISLEDKEKWRSTILEIQENGYIRENEKDKIEKNKYDLKKEVSKIEKIYLN